MKLRLGGAILAFAIICIFSCQNEDQIEYNRYYSSGSLLYQNHCQNCHGDKGQGLAALIPPLTDSSYFKTNRAKLACYIQNGIKGPITINNKVFDDEMKPHTDLTPIEIAEVLTYVGNTFGNKLHTINEDEVQASLAGCK